MMQQIIGLTGYIRLSDNRLSDGLLDYQANMQGLGLGVRHSPLV